MKKTEVLKSLKSMGTAQNRKVYGRHGVTGAMFGVSYANLGKLKRQIKVDQALALQLWSSGNHDARILATMVADPGAMTAKMLDGWVKDVDNHVTSAAVAGVVAACPPGSRSPRSGFVRAMSGWEQLDGLRSPTSCGQIGYPKTSRMPCSARSRRRSTRPRTARATR